MKALARAGRMAALLALLVAALLVGADGRADKRGGGGDGAGGGGGGRGKQKPTITIGSKKFTESTLLGEMLAQLAEAHAGVRVVRRYNLGGTQLAYTALKTGEIDCYVEYTGTALRAILKDKGSAQSASAVFARVSRAAREQDKLLWLAPFGFSNTYVLIAHVAAAKKHALRKISDLLRVPDLRWGMSYEFLRRDDGMVGLRRAYKLAPKNLVGMEHDLVYQALKNGKVDVSDSYSTDAKLLHADAVILRDDRRFFPPYEAAPLVRAELAARAPAVIAAFSMLAGRIDNVTMRVLNGEVELSRKRFASAARVFLQSRGLIGGKRVVKRRALGFFALLWQRRGKTLRLTAEHLMLSGVAVLAACLLGIPIGVMISRRPRASALTLAAAGVLQTIPSIALLAFMLPLFGVGAKPAIFALFLYGLLPILRNTVTGLRGVDPRLLEVGTGLGMRPMQRLWRVELPLAAPTILAGVRTSMVINIGTATLAAFIGAGGLGEPIVTGLSLTDTDLVLAGAVPAALLAVIVDALLAGVERLATPRGLRVRREHD
ncbi:MAG: ABC transporter permease subunit [Myxococcales bacterium]|nr:ABC transporter permease subunit [Myxococcales bacterium]